MLNRKHGRFSLLAALVGIVVTLSGLTFAQPASASVLTQHHIPSVHTSKIKPLTGCPTTCYSYAGYYQAPSPAPTDVLMSVDVKAPSRDGDYHSLDEIAVQSLDEQQAVEAGWTVDFGLYGDNLPRLFVSSWKNGVFQGYNNANFTTCTVPICGVAASAVPGANLSSYIGPTAQTFGISYFSGKYWVKFGSGWVGFFSATNWSGVSPAFTNVPLFKAFGEVAAVNTVPCAQMGDGVQGSTITGAARMGSLTYVGTTATATFTGNFTTPGYYSTAFLTAGTTRSFAYGGDNAAC